PKGLKLFFPDKFCLQDWSKHDERLLQAVENNDSEKVGSLLTKRSLFAAKQDSDGRSAYHLAAMKGYVDCLEVILSHGVDVSAMDSSGKAFSANKPNELSPHLASQDGCSPLILAAQMSNHEICRWLIVRGADVNTRDKQGRTALMLACENDSVETVEVLVRSRANVGLVDALGHDAVHYSMVTGNTEILHLLHMGPHRRYWSKSKWPSFHPNLLCAVLLFLNHRIIKSYSTEGYHLEDQKLSNEIFLLQQERDHLLHTISNLEQLVDKCQREVTPIYRLIPSKTSKPFEAHCCAQLAAAFAHKYTVNSLYSVLCEMECLQKESDKEDISGGEDFIPILLYDSLRAEFEKLKEECELLRDQATVHEEGMSSETLVPLETYEQLKASHEQEVLKLQEALNELKAKMDLEVEGCIQPHLESELASVEKNTEQDIQDMTEKLNEVQERYETAMKEVERLDEMEEKLTHSISLETFEELRTSLNISLEEISKENALLMEKYTEAQDELKQLRAANEAEESHLGSCEEGTKVSPEFTATADELKEKLEKLTKSYSELEERFRVLQEEHETKEKELGSLQEELTAMHVPKHKHEEVKQKLSKSLSDANEQLLEIKGKHNTIRQEVTRLQSEVEEQRVHFMPRDEHLKMKEAFEAMKGTVSHLENQLASKQKEYSQLQRQVETTREQTTLKDEQESTVTSLKAEVNSLTIKLNDLTKKHERTCTEVFQVQREALFMKSQKHSAEDELAATQKQLQDLKADSKKITELHKQIEDSAELVKEKDKKITELSKEVFRLKEALNSLSERSNAAAQRVQPAPYKTQPNLEYLESQIKALQHQLKVKNHHKAILSIYRTHLLYAIQGQKVLS
uniref:Uncharacterized protein n=1 Tax=Callorhinchus milii TaxID=7868 RepID=A0A4W3K3D4_CALMI